MRAEPKRFSFNHNWELTTISSCSSMFTDRCVKIRDGNFTQFHKRITVTVVSMTNINLFPWQLLWKALR